MKLHALLLVAVGLMIGADAPKDDAAKKELKKLEGSYVMISGEEKGDKLPETTVKNAKLIIDGDKRTVKVGDETIIGQGDQKCQEPFSSVLTATATEKAVPGTRILG